MTEQQSPPQEKKPPVPEQKERPAAEVEGHPAAEQKAPPAVEEHPAVDAAADAPSPPLVTTAAEFTAPLDAATQRQQQDVADNAPAMPAAATPAAKPAPETPAPYGLELKAGRERMGIRPADVAASLHLEESVIRAMEEGREGELPARVYVRGYIRAYANLLGLDADQLAAQFDLSAPAAETDAPPVLAGHGRAGKKAVRADLPQRRAGVFLGVVVVVIVVALAGTLWGVWRSFDWSFVTDVAGGGLAAPPWRSEPSERDGSAAPSPSVGDGGPAAATNAESERPEQASTPVAELEFTFKEDSWVEVSDRSRMLFAELGTAGQSVSVTGHPPFNITIGYAAGVELRYQGEAIALAPHTQGGQANLVVH